MTLDSPVNGSSPAIRDDYNDHKAKGEISRPPRSDKTMTLLSESVIDFKESRSFIGFFSPDVARSAVCLRLLL